MIRNWWKPYFNIAYILGDNNDDFTSRHRRLEKRTGEETRGILSLTRVPKGPAVLDVPCGYGRHSIALAARGFTVHAIESNPLFLAVARYRAKCGLNTKEKQVYPRRLTSKTTFHHLRYAKTSAIT